MDSSTKSIIDRLWLNLATEGISNPLEAIEQITYLLFIKSLDDEEIKRESDDNILGVKSKEYLMLNIKIADGANLEILMQLKCMKICKKMFFHL